MSEIKKEKILSSAHSLFLKYGIKSVSMDDIARLLGISKKTIYNFVTNKKGLVHSVVSAFIAEEESACSKITKSSPNAVAEMISIAQHVQGTLKTMKPSLTYDLKKYHPNTWKLIAQDHFDFVENHIKENIKRGIKEGFYRPEIRLDIVPKLFVSISKMIADGEISSQSNLTQSELYESAMFYHMHGIMNTKGRKELAKYLKNLHEK